MIKKKTHTNLYKQRLHVKKNLKKFLNSIKLFLLFSTEINVYNVKKNFENFLNSIKLFLLFSTEINNIYM